MRRQRFRDPVRPLLIAANFFRCSVKGCTSGNCAAREHVVPVIPDVVEETVRHEDVDFGNHIVGPSSPRTKPTLLKSPREMTAAEWEEHMVTHLPYCPSCPHCVAGKRCNDHHRTSTTERELPLLVADYGYLRDSLSDDTLPFIVCHIKPYRIYFASAIDLKGNDPTIVK